MHAITNDTQTPQISQAQSTPQPSLLAPSQPRYEFECLRCPHKWNRRDPLSTHKPVCCPRCKSPAWDKPYKRPKHSAPATPFSPDDWSRMAGSIIDTVHLTPEDDLYAALVAQLQRYFGGNLSTCEIPSTPQASTKVIPGIDG